MTNYVTPWILRAQSALHSIDTSILVFYHQDRQGRTDIRLRPRPAWPPVKLTTVLNHGPGFYPSFLK